MACLCEEEDLGRYLTVFVQSKAGRTPDLLLYSGSVRGKGVERAGEISEAR
jgi:hypothetical protein